MILYLDTSSLVKLYFAEQGTEEVKELVAKAEAVVTSVVAWIEARSAFAKKRRERDLGDLEYKRAVRALRLDWPGYLRIHLSEKVSEQAGSLVERYPLRTLDAIHLASYLMVESQLRKKVTFSSFDDRLNQIVEKLKPVR